MSSGVFQKLLSGSAHLAAPEGSSLVHLFMKIFGPWNNLIEEEVRRARERWSCRESQSEEVFLKFDDLWPLEAGGSPEDDPSAADGASSTLTPPSPLFFFSLHGFIFVEESINNFPETEIKVMKKKTKWKKLSLSLSLWQMAGHWPMSWRLIDDWSLQGALVIRHVIGSPSVGGRSPPPLDRSTVTPQRERES